MLSSPLDVVTDNQLGLLSLQRLKMSEEEEETACSRPDPGDKDDGDQVPVRDGTIDEAVIDPADAAAEQEEDEQEGSDPDVEVGEVDPPPEQKSHEEKPGKLGFSIAQVRTLHIF